MVGFVDITHCLNNQETPRTQSPDPSSRLADVLQRLDAFVPRVNNTKEDSEMADTHEDWEVEGDEEQEYIPPANSFFHLPQSNKSSVALSLLHTASSENSLRRIEQSSRNYTNSTDNDLPYNDYVGPNPAVLEEIDKEERFNAANHLREARSRIRQSGNKDYVKRIESPKGVSPKIPAMERTFEPREDPKAQLLGVMFGDPSWSGKRILDEM
ncbi:hypothetical protein G7Y79_00061g092930 [Physcia stellaris]|nr:hypothetical protein G7Y79_00061g092930 [Physcia stellaris]